MESSDQGSFFWRRLRDLDKIRVTKINGSTISLSQILRRCGYRFVLRTSNNQVIENLRKNDQGIKKMIFADQNS